MACRAPAVFWEYHPSVTRRRWILWVLGALPAFGLAVGGVVLAAFLRADAQLKRHEAAVAGLTRLLDARDLRRPVAIGDPVDGNAWGFYDQAFRIPDWMDTSHFDWDQVGKLRRDPRVQVVDDNPEMQGRILNWAREALGPLREGVRRTRVDPDIRRPFREYDLRIERSSTSIGLMATLIVQHHEAGQDAAALETAALLLAAGQDLSRNGYLEGAQHCTTAEFAVLGTCRQAFRGWAATSAELGTIAGKLDALDRTRETLRETWRIEGLRRRKYLLEETSFEDPRTHEALQPGWRCLFSTRLMRVQALNICESAYRRMVDAADLEPHARYQASLRLGEEMQDHPNPVLYHHLNLDDSGAKVWTVPGLQRGDVFMLTQRALFRMAVALAWFEAETGKPPERLEALVPKYLSKIPTCAMSGQAFRYSPGRVWSVGANAVDDGGVSPEPDDPSTMGGGDKDIVWQVRRKAP
jgi:hypothetical protein